MTDKMAYPSEEDRRALLSVYSAAQLQYPGVAVASCAAVIAELVVYFYPSYSSLVPHALFLALIPPTLAFISLVVNGYLLERDAVLLVLREPLPSRSKLRETLASSGALAKSNEPEDGLSALDAYYTYLVNKDPNPVTSYMLRGPKVMLGTLVAVFLGLFLVFVLLGV